MNLKPIPKKYLIHSAVLRNRSVVTDMDAPSYNEVRLENVRVETKETVKYSREKRMLVFSAVMFIDAKNSTVPENINVDDEVVFDGKTYSVQSVSKLYTFDGVSFHHLEIGLV